MARVKLVGPIAAIRGKWGGVVFKKRGKTLYISRPPDFSKRKLSVAQKRSVRRFAAAVKYTKRTMADTKARKRFERIAKKAGKTVFHTIMTDFLRKHK